MDNWVYCIIDIIGKRKEASASDIRVYQQKSLKKQAVDSMMIAIYNWVLLTTAQITHGSFLTTKTK